MSSNYQRYKSIKDSFNVCYKGYDLKSIMSQLFIYVTYKAAQAPCGWLSIKQNLFYGLSFAEAVSDMETKDIILFSYFNRRADYSKFLTNVISTVDNSILMTDLDTNIFKFNLFTVLISFFQVFFTSFRNIRLSFRERFYYFLKLVYLKNSIANLENQVTNIQIKSHVTFLSAEWRSSLLCQFFSKNGVVNYGMQHGLHLPVGYYSKYIPLDVLNIENFQADLFLAWGGCMKEIFEAAGISEKRVLIAGNPNYSKVDILAMDNGPCNRLIVCFGRSMYRNENISLLKLAIKLCDEGVNVAVKIHPTDDWIFYQDLLNGSNIEKLPVKLGIRDSVDYFNPDYVIVVNSTVYYEYLMCGVFCFRFRDSGELPIGLDDKVYDFESFCVKLKKIQSYDTSELQIEVKDTLSDVFALGQNNYNKILNNKQV